MDGRTSYLDLRRDSARYDKQWLGRVSKIRCWPMERQELQVNTRMSLHTPESADLVNRAPFSLDPNCVEGPDRKIEPPANGSFEGVWPIHQSRCRGRTVLRKTAHIRRPSKGLPPERPGWPWQDRDRWMDSVKFPPSLNPESIQHGPVCVPERGESAFAALAQPYHGTTGHGQEWCCRGMPATLNCSAAAAAAAKLCGLERALMSFPNVAERVAADLGPPSQAEQTALATEKAPTMRGECGFSFLRDSDSSDSAEEEAQEDFPAEGEPYELVEYLYALDGQSACASQDAWDAEMAYGSGPACDTTHLAGTTESRDAILFYNRPPYRAIQRRKRRKKRRALVRFSCTLESVPEQTELRVDCSMEEDAAPEENGNDQAMMQALMHLGEQGREQRQPEVCMELDPVGTETSIVEGLQKAPDPSDTSKLPLRGHEDKHHVEPALHGQEEHRRVDLNVFRLTIETDFPEDPVEDAARGLRNGVGKDGSPSGSREHQSCRALMSRKKSKTALTSLSASHWMSATSRRPSARLLREIRSNPEDRLEKLGDRSPDRLQLVPAAARLGLGRKRRAALGYNLTPQKSQ
eukprot:scaffold7574_cov277-Pinguiococcus_pyrenoidosus.AAC.1